jgi:hypothetical protein
MLNFRTLFAAWVGVLRDDVEVFFGRDNYCVQVRFVVSAFLANFADSVIFTLLRLRSSHIFVLHLLPSVRLANQPTSSA